MNLPTGVTDVDTHHNVSPITEDDIAQFLVNTPDFFVRHADLLSSVQLTSPHSHRAVSLQERQAEMLREKIRHLELKFAQMLRHGQDNVLIADRLLAWAAQLMLVPEPLAVPDCVTVGLQAQFQVPQAAIKVWGVAPAWADQAFAQGASDDAQVLANSLTRPYCGNNPGLEPSRWLAQPEAVASIALLPLRASPDAPAFGLLVLASDDAKRFTEDMGTEFLERIAELAAAALSRLRPV